MFMFGWFMSILARSRRLPSACLPSCILGKPTSCKARRAALGRVSGSPPHFGSERGSPPQAAASNTHHKHIELYTYTYKA